MKSYILTAVVALCMLAMNSATAQPASGDVTFAVAVAAVPLTVAVNTGIDIAGVSQGSSQSISPDGAGSALETAVANPNPNLAVNSVGDIDITGDPGSTVVVSFALPTRLVAAGGGSGSVTVTYNGTSACFVDPAGNINYFDPSVPARGFLDPAGGTLKVYLGGIFKVATGSAPDSYVGDAIITASYPSNAE